jgi:hypothetical protein
MIENIERIGNLTSSQAYRLVGFDRTKKEPSAAFYTYVEEKIYERALKRSLDLGAYGRSMAWGKFLENRVHALLGLEYQLISSKSFVHPKFDFWAGSPDMIVPSKKVSEIKCYEPKKFCSYVSSLLTKDTEIIKTNHPQEYWQIVSNCCILGYPTGEAVVYMPYESELEEIIEMAENPEYINQIGMQPWEVRFITESSASNLATLPDNARFLNLNKFEFSIPAEDIIFLTQRMIKAGKLLTNGHKNNS